jgi:photosynthetic reaction center H subunit
MEVENMGTGAITEYIDVAQLVLYAFWIFFAGLILYLRREDKREGYPLESDRAAHVRVEGFPGIPSPKTFLLQHGGTVQAPPSDGADDRPVAAQPAAPWPGAPLVPTGNPMIDGVGPAAWADRADTPDLTLEGVPRIVPMRVAPEFSIEERDPDPRGMEVLGADGLVAGTVTDVWVDRAEPQVRYLEVGLGALAEGPRVLLPIGMAVVDRRRREIRVASILTEQFAAVPTLRNDDRITLLEEDRVCAYYGGGTLYATPARQESLL